MADLQASAFFEIGTYIAGKPARIHLQAHRGIDTLHAIQRATDTKRSALSCCSPCQRYATSLPPGFATL